MWNKFISPRPDVRLHLGEFDQMLAELDHIGAMLLGFMYESMWSSGRASSRFSDQLRPQILLGVTPGLERPPAEMMPGDHRSEMEADVRQTPH